MADSWCTIESDPGVFTELIETFGVNGVQVEELYSLDELGGEGTPIYGLIFLFKYRREQDDRPTVGDMDEPGLFFASQVIPNACATQAILSVLLNAEGVNLGGTLSDFKAFTGDFSSELKGLAIGNSDAIREAHNSFARAEPFVMEEAKSATDKGDVFHFIAYVPYGGKVYELDGLKPGPILLGAQGSGGDWLTVAQPAITARIQRYASSEIRFNLMGIVKNKKEVYQEVAAVQEARRAAVLAAQGGGAAMEADGAPSLGDGWVVAADAAGQATQLADAEAKHAEAQRGIAAEEEKFAAWKIENVRRKHNYIPFVVNLFRILAERGQLKPMIEKAQSARRE